MTALRFALLASAAAMPLAAQETRELHAHEHGVSTLEIAVEHGHVEMNLTSPGMDLVGFEYEASTVEDKEAVEAAIQVLNQPDKIVTLDPAAGCRLDEAAAHLLGGDHEGEHDDDDEHAHAGEEEHEGHDEHAEDEEHEEHDHADDKHDGDGEPHNEFRAHYKFTCDTPENLAMIELPFFAAFPNAEEVEAIFVTEAGAGAAEISREAARLMLK